MKWKIVIILSALLFIAAMIGYSSFYERTGFPLDDAWIHQTYARNLAEYGNFYFQRGEVSAGSTAPLWTIILAIGYWLKQPFIWTYSISLICLAGVGIIGESLYRTLTRTSYPIPWFGLFLVGDWHLLWSAGSGMETILFVFLEFLLIFCLVQEKPSQFALGIITGALIWTRPDGLTWVGPVVLVNLLTGSWKQRIKNTIHYLIIVFIFLLLYGLFNNAIGGSWLPNTYSAKQAEYNILLNEPFVDRFLRLFSVVWVGGGIFLLPGVMAVLILILRSLIKNIYKHRWQLDKQVIILSTLVIWGLGYVLLYALRLPVVYQHGRYVIPAMPIFYLVGGFGIYTFIKLEKIQGASFRIFFKVMQLSLVFVWLGFMILGISTYANDVAIINTEMVDTAYWVRDNLPDDTILAVHDIGAIGYFAPQKIIDLAGLISPEVIPIITNEKALSAHIIEKNAEYLVIFPGWYETLGNDSTIIYESEGRYAPEAGGENMTIYALKK